LTFERRSIAPKRETLDLDFAIETYIDSVPLDMKSKPAGRFSESNRNLRFSNFSEGENPPDYE